MRSPRSLVAVGLLGASVASAQEPAPAAPSANGLTAPAPAIAADGPAKPTERAARKGKKRKATNGPVANYPSFRIMPDGSSRIHVQVSAKVSVEERKAEGRLAYRLKGASVPVRTNRLPLETSFFKTAVARVSLTEVGEEDAELVVELRQAAAVAYKTVDTDAGMLLQVDVAAPTQAPAPPPSK